MGKRYIDADKLKAHYAWWKGGTREMTMDEAKSDFDCIIDLQPTVEAEPKHGRWVATEKGAKITAYKCSKCGRVVWDDTGYDVSKDYPYCHCGADMRGGENEN